MKKIGLLLLLLVLLVACGQTDKENGSDNASKESKDQKTNDEYVTTNIGEAFNLEGWGVTLESFEISSTVTSDNTSTKPDDGNQYLILNFKVINNGTEADTLFKSRNGAVLKAIYDEKYEYGVAITLLRDDLQEKNVNPLAETTGFVAVPIPNKVVDEADNIQLFIEKDKDKVQINLPMGQASVSQTENSDSEVEENESKSEANETLTITKGEPLVIDDYAEITVNDHIFGKRIDPPNPSSFYSYYEVKEDAEIYLDTIITVKSLLTSSKSSDEFVNVKVVYDNKYDYRTFSTIEDKGGADFTYTNITSIEPLKEGILHYIASLPEELENDGKPLKLVISAKNKNYELVIR